MAAEQRNENRQQQEGSTRRTRRSSRSSATHLLLTVAVRQDRTVVGSSRRARLATGAACPRPPLVASCPSLATLSPPLDSGLARGLRPGFTCRARGPCPDCLGHACAPTHRRARDLPVSRLSTVSPLPAPSSISRRHASSHFFPPPHVRAKFQGQESSHVRRSGPRGRRVDELDDAGRSVRVVPQDGPGTCCRGPSLRNLGFLHPNKPTTAPLDLEPGPHAPTTPPPHQPPPADSPHIAGPPRAAHV